MEKIKVTEQEWAKVSKSVKEKYEKAYEKNETARTVYFIIDGDLINPKKAGD